MDLNSIPEFEDGTDQNHEYCLRLFVTGASPNSTRAIKNIKKICESYLSGRYKLDIIDVYQQPLIAQGEQIIAIPLLVRKYPLPERRLIGDMSDLKKVLTGLEIKHDEDGAKHHK